MLVRRPLLAVHRSMRISRLRPASESAPMAGGAVNCDDDILTAQRERGEAGAGATVQYGWCAKVPGLAVMTVSRPEPANWFPSGQRRSEQAARQSRLPLFQQPRAKYAASALRARIAPCDPL
jgi:hypothetical protein